MKYFVRVLLVIFIGNIIVEQIVEGNSEKAIVKDGSASTIVNSTTCPSATFDDGGVCTLTCTVRCQGKLNDIKPEWIYKSVENSTDSYSILNGWHITHSSDVYMLSLDLEDYRSGFYIAQLSCSDGELSCPPLNISASEGVALGSPCNNSKNCSVLNAVCTTDKNLCDCPAEKPFHANLSNPSACLPVATAGTECQIDEQCQDGDLDLACEKKRGRNVGICSCQDPSYYLRYDDDMDKFVCIKFEIFNRGFPDPLSSRGLGQEVSSCPTRVTYGDDCSSDNDCDCLDISMECDSTAHCDCEYGYYYDYYIDFCVYNPWTAYLSVTAVIGIVFGVILLIILVVTGFALCLRPKMLRSRPAPPPPTTVENQFSSFNEPSVIWNAGQEPTYPVDGPPNYTEAGGLDSPPPPFESEIVIKTRLEDPPLDSSNNSNPFHQTQQQQWFDQPNQPSQVQEQRPDLYTPQSTPSEMQPEYATQGQLNSNEQFFFQNPHYQSNLAFEEDC